MVAKEASIITALGHMPISFTDGKKGMVLFAQSLLNIGRSVFDSKQIDANDLLHCATSIPNAIHYSCSHQIRVPGHAS